MFKRNRATEPPVLEVGEYREPDRNDVQFHYRSAEYWLRVAEQPGRNGASTTAAAGISQAHAAIALAACQILSNSKIAVDINEAAHRFIRPPS